MKLLTKIKNLFKKKLDAKQKRKLFIFCMLILPVLHFLVFFVYVNIDTIVLSFQRFDYQIGKYVFVGFDNYKTNIRDLFELPGIKTAIINSLLFFPITNFVLLPLSIVFSYFFFRKVPGRNIFRILFFLPSIISIVVLTMSFQFMFDPLFGPISGFLSKLGIDPVGGWFGNKTTVMPMIFIYCIWAGIGFNVVFLSSAISRLPQEVIENARLDGIGMFKELTLIIVPMIWPTITTLFVVGTTAVFTIFLQNMLLANGGPSGASKTIAYLIVELVQSGNLNDSATLGVIFSVIGIPLIFLIKVILDKISKNVEY